MKEHVKGWKSWGWWKSLKPNEVTAFRWKAKEDFNPREPEVNLKIHHPVYVEEYVRLWVESRGEYLEADEEPRDE